jgi:hypothetical protein
MPEQHTEVNCVQKDAIDKMSVKIDKIYDALCTDEMDGSRISILSRLRQIEQATLGIKLVVDRLDGHEKRLTAVETKVAGHFTRHDSAQSKRDKYMFFLVSTTLGVVLTAIVVWVINGGLAK